MCVTAHILRHSHEISKEIYEDYPEVRKTKNKSMLKTVEAMHAHGTPRKGILEYMTKNSTIAPTMKDVHNLLAQMKKARYGEFPSVEARVKLFLSDFCAVTGNVGRVFADDQNTVKCVTMQTAHMRTMFDQFPEVILIDATHNTNKAHYKLFSFMVHDALGRGQHVQVSFVPQLSCWQNLVR